MFMGYLNATLMEWYIKEVWPWVKQYQPRFKQYHYPETPVRIVEMALFIIGHNH